MSLIVLVNCLCGKTVNRMENNLGVNFVKKCLQTSIIARFRDLSTDLLYKIFWWLAKRQQNSHNLLARVVAAPANKRIQSQ